MWVSRSSSLNGTQEGVIPLQGSESISLEALSPAHILSLEYGQSKWERPELAEKLKNYRPVREAVAERDTGHLVTYKVYIELQELCDPSTLAIDQAPGAFLLIM